MASWVSWAPLAAVMGFAGSVASVVDHRGASRIGDTEERFKHICHVVMLILSLSIVLWFMDWVVHSVRTAGMQVIAV